MNNLGDIRAGIWRHYKGPLYQVLGYSHNASDENNPQVLYIGLVLDRAKPGPRFATRDVDEWTTIMCTRHMCELDACPPVAHREHETVLRFEYLGPVYYAGMEQS